MTIDDEGLALLKHFESLRLKAYQDEKGIWTIGYGHTSGVKEGDTCTFEQAEAWLKEDLSEAVKAVDRLVHVPLTGNEFSALVCFTYNVGVGKFAKSTMLTRLNDNEKLAAAEEFLKWNKVGKKTSRGLTRRRVAERNLFLKS
jgi:lysozyme